MIRTSAAGPSANYSDPWEAENSSRNYAAKSTAAAAWETENDHMATLDPRIEPASFSTAVDIGPDTNPSPKPKASFWSRITKAATVVEERLAEWFGLNDSKYQWAVDEFMDRQLAGESQVKPASFKDLNQLPSEPTSQQAMHKDSNEVDDV